MDHTTTKSASTDATQSRAERLASYIETRAHWAVLSITCVYFAITLLLAHRKPFWEDEFFTLYLSRLGPRANWSALMTGGDQQPPLFYWLTHGVMSVFGVHHISLRLPAMFGIALACLCAYWIVSRRTSPAYGFAAMMMPLVTVAHTYAYEARGYGWSLGMASAAVVCWLAAAEGRRRVLALFGLAFTLALALSGHYYAVLMFVPLGLGEAVRTWTRRRVDAPVWAAFAASGVPLLFYLPVIRAARTYSGTFWGFPEWWRMLDYADFLLAPATVPLIFAPLFAAWYLSIPNTHEKRETRRLPAHELALLLGLVALPFLTMILAKIITNGFTHRYVMYPIIALSVLVPLLASAAFGGRRPAALGLTLVLLTCFCVASLQDSIQHWITLLDLTSGETLLQNSAKGDSPIVITEATTFYQLSFYAPRSLANRLVYLADKEQSVHYLRHDTIDRGLLDLRRWFPLNAVPYRDFLSARPGFFAYGHITWMTWHLWALSKDTPGMQLVGRERQSLLFWSPGEFSHVVNPGAPPLEAARSLPRTSSLCWAMTADRICSVF
jgi:hypothetical protein